MAQQEAALLEALEVDAQLVDLVQRNDAAQRATDVQRLGRAREPLAQFIDHARERRATFHFIEPRPFEAAVQADQFRSVALLGAQLREGRAAVLHHPGHAGQCLHIVHHCGPVEETLLRRVGWPRAHLATLPFYTVQQSGLLTTYIGTCRLDHLEAVVPTAALDVRADPSLRFDVRHRLLHDIHRLRILRPDV